MADEPSKRSAPQPESAPAPATAAAPAPTPAQGPETVARAWALSYLDPLAARDLGAALAAQGGPEAAEGWLHVALAEVRVGDRNAVPAALARARELFTARADAVGLDLCDEVLAIQLRGQGDHAASAQVQAESDLRPNLPRGPMHRFLRHNSRAITCKMRGQVDDTLRHFYAARDAAAETGWAGPLITATSNLGGFHHALFNLEDARVLSEQALRDARSAGARQIVGSAASNLVTIYYAMGEHERARDMAEFMIGHAHEMVPGALQHYALSLALGYFAVGDLPLTMHFLKPGAAASPGDGTGLAFWAWLQARCLLAGGDAAGARDLAERLLQQRLSGEESTPYDLMQCHRVLADACEAMGDTASALRYVRESQALYELLVGRSARARFIALDVGHRLAQAQRERDLAVHSHRTAEDDRRRLEELNLALQAQVATTEMLHAKLREQALHDPLTGLHNRRYLFESAPGLLELARRQGSQMCAVMIDLDHFKHLNDTYGHQMGDQVLQRFATLLRGMLRRSDLVCRYGGEEFVAVMPDIDAEGAYVMLGRVLEAYLGMKLGKGDDTLPPGTFSAGIALFPQHGDTLEQLLQRADLALYAAKGMGRARIEIATLSGHGALN